MSLPQGINFRATSGYVTDGANEDCEAVSSGGATQTYPRTTAQGNTVGWETVGGSYQGRDRSTGFDNRLAGINFNDGLDPVVYRIDLPAPGVYKIGIAAGDTTVNQVNWDLYDGTTSLGTLTSGTISGGQIWKDATNTEYNDTTWPTSQTLITKTFATSILRISSIGLTQVIAHLYVEAVTAVIPPGMCLT